MRRYRPVISSKALLLVCCVFTHAWTHAQSQGKTTIDSLIQVMSIEEKVGQMTLLNLPMLLKARDGKTQHPVQLDSARLHEAIGQHHVGAFLNTADHALERSTWTSLISNIQDYAKARGELPILYGIDAIHGANYTAGSTLFPHQLMQAATFNDSLVKEAARITAYECRASGITWVFSPILDLGRQPLWTQFFETFGEDPYLAGSMGQAMVLGYQQGPSNESVAACGKHFIGGGFPFSGKDRTPVYIGERRLRSIYLPPFQAAVEAGVKTIIVGTSEIDGIPLHAHSYLLNDVLRGECGFDGVIVSDWGDVENLHRLHRISDGYPESIRIAIQSGIDLVMVPNDFTFSKTLVQLVNDGTISMQRIDASVRRILQLKEDLGLLHQPTQAERIDYARFASQAHATHAYELAIEGTTLLENDGILPLNKDQRILVCGPACNDLALQHGSWSRTWQGTDTLIANESSATLLESMRAISPHIKYVDVGTVDTLRQLQSLRSMAEDRDVIVVCLGERPGTEKPGDIKDLSISKAQQRLMQALLKTGKPIVLVLMQNRPQIIHAFAEQCDAVIMAYQPGGQGGRALADVLYGIRNPSGRLPFTYPSHVNDFLTYDHTAIEELDVHYGSTAYAPQWPFGHGLSYGSVSYDQVELESDSLRFKDTLKIQVSLRNNGSRSTKEVILLYVSDEVASVVPPVRQLKLYRKVDLAPSRPYSALLEVPISSLAFPGLDPTVKVLEAGWYIAEVGDAKLRFYIH